MKIGPVASLFFDPWEIQFEQTGIKLPHKEPKLNFIPYKDIKYIQIRGKENAWFFATGSIVTTESDHEELFPGLSIGSLGSINRAKSFEKTCYKKTSQYFTTKINPAIKKLEEAFSKLKNLESAKSYISTADVWDYCNIPEQVVECIEHSLFKKSFGFFPNKTKGLLEPFINIQEGNDEFINEINEKFIKKEMTELGSWFDNEIEKNPLTELQRRACIINPENTLVIASAGSGKTSTIIGKAAYLIKRNLAVPEEILLLTFSKKVKEELIQRLDVMFKKMGMEGTKPEVGTFHSFGLGVIGEVTGKKPSLSGMVDSDDSLGIHKTQVYEKILQDLQEEEPSFYRKWLEFLATARVPVKRVHLFESEREYNDTISSYPFKFDNKRIKSTPERKIPALSGDFVKSQEELAVANLLWVNGINFEYEKEYLHDLADEEKQQYQPDFYYPDIKLWHEHFALDSRGKAPEFMDASKYKKDVKWKRAVHKEHKTKFFETRSDDYFTGRLDSKILKRLKEEGLEFTPRSDEEIEKRVKEFYNLKEFSLLSQFIKYCKTLFLTEQMISEKLLSLEDQYRARKFLEIIIPIFNKYQENLEQAGEIDFEDMIIEATKHVESKEFISKYKYIIIDEFQDTSRDKASLIRSLKKQNEAKLFCVGDDWQSIYRFAGSDINLMYDFSAEFGATEEVFLDKTFRCNRVIAELGATFIEKNELQKKKEIKAREPQNDRSLNFHWVDRLNNKYTKKVLSKVSKGAKQDKRKNIFILSRNKAILGDNNYQKIRWNDIHEQFSLLDIKQDSIHASKGLERNIVVLMGLESGQAGFPNLMDNDPLTDCLLPREESYPHAEERRLLYVCLTRAFDEVHVVATRRKRSPFFMELLEDAQEFNPIIYTHDNIVRPCPECIAEGRDRWFSLVKNWRKIERDTDIEYKVGMTCGVQDSQGQYHESFWPAECPNCYQEGNSGILKVERDAARATVICINDSCNFELDFNSI